MPALIPPSNPTKRAIRQRELRGQLSPEQQAAIKKDTRLVGEIACSYGVSAKVILRIQRKSRQGHRRVNSGK